MNPFASARLVGVVAIIMSGCAGRAIADDLPVPTALAKRGKLILDDDGSKDRGGKTIVDLNDGIGLKTALGSWERAAPKSNVWRSTWKEGMGHPPVAAYQGVDAKNLIVEVTFRYGEATEPWHSQFLRIAADQRPQLKGHIVSAWVNPKGRYTKTGFVLEHVGKRDEKTGNRGLLLDHQPINSEPETWYTATLEIVDDEALFRMGDHVAYAKAEQIRMPKNLVSLTLGTTWHEIERVRIWHAEANPEWGANKDTILKSRKPFTTRSRAAGAHVPSVARDQELTASDTSTLEQVKTAGALRSSYRKPITQTKTDDAPQANLKAFRAEIEPILAGSCVECHGPKKQKAKFRVDVLDPDLVNGKDTERWLEVMDVLSHSEMPPEDAPELADDDRNKIIEWLSSEIQMASQVHRAEQGHSSFRRMTRYEYNYALQDLLGLALDFAKDLPPDSVSEDGFRNSSEMLQMSASQYGDYLELNRNALNRATVRGERPEMLYWGVSAERASAQKFLKSGNQKRESRTRGRQRGGRGGGSHYKNTETGQTVPATWAFRRAVHAWAPTMIRPEVPEQSDYIAVLPAGQRLVVELGNRLPDEGTLRVRIRASRVSTEDNLVPSVALEFGWQGSNNSKGSVKISERDFVIDASPGKPQFYQWDIPLSEIYPRNPVRKTVELGTPKMTNPSEYIRLHNTSLSPSADIQFDYVEVSAPVYEQWPPASHTGIFIDSENSEDENAYAREIVSRFMARSWRRSVTDAEVDRKMEFFARIRPVCEDFQHAVIEVLATVLSSPRFLYLVQSDRSPKEADRKLDEFELATRLSMFLWCSTPDDELLDLAAKGRLGEKDELVRQTKRMLADPRHERFSKHFVRQWLNMELLDFLTVDRSTYPQFDRILQDAMQQEPIEFFEEVLQNDHSVMDFIHADYALVNQRLAQHYGISDVNGNHFQKVSLKPEGNRGGLLTQAGLLAMNSDGTDSNPLKRGIWLLESILNDPPPPPPPAVPEIDLADPEILKLTLKQRIEDHRNKPACISCHMKIDPWGIAFENFDAVGTWRTQSQGKDIDASSLLFNQQELDGVDGLKRYLLTNWQDQFARAIVHKMTTFALGRPLTFADRSSVDRLTAELRKEGDGLATLLTLIVASDIFQSR